MICKRMNHLNDALKDLKLEFKAENANPRKNWHIWSASERIGVLRIFQLFFYFSFHC